MNRQSLYFAPLGIVVVVLLSRLSSVFSNLSFKFLDSIKNTLIRTNKTYSHS